MCVHGGSVVEHWGGGENQEGVSSVMEGRAVLSSYRANVGVGEEREGGRRGLSVVGGK